MHTSDIGHERARELAANAVDFELDDADLDELDGHLAGCDDCRRFAAGLAADRATLAALPRRAAPPSILAAIRREAARPRDRFRPLLVVVAAVTASALFLTTIVGGGRPQHTPSPTDSSSPSALADVLAPSLSPTEAAAASTGPIASVSAQALVWSQVTRQRSFHDPFGVMEAVASGSRLVAVGDGCASSLATCHGAIWTSDDGTAWQRVPDAPEFAVGPYTLARRGEMTDVIATADGFVAVGRSREGGGRRAAAWWSNDGLRWSRSDDTKSLQLGTMEAVVAGPDGLVAVGNVVDGDAASAGAWLSTDDGVSWSKAGGGPADLAVGGQGTFTDGRVHGGMIDVVWDGTRFVAVGSACEPAGGHCHGVAWNSSDGRTWARASDGLTGTPYTLVAGPGVLVAAGDDGNGHPVSWTSTDGAAWTAGRPVSGVTGNFDAIIATPSGFAGSMVAADGASTIATSTDGRSWQVVAVRGVLGEGAINGLAWDPVRGIAIGVGWDGRTPAAAVWTGR